MEAAAAPAPWLPGLILAVASSIILVLFIATLLLARLPRLQKWLAPVLARIAPSKPKAAAAAAAGQGVLLDGQSTLIYQQHPSAGSSQYQRYGEKVFVCPAAAGQGR